MCTRFARIEHLGNFLQSENKMRHDVALKRGKFIGSLNSMLQELHFVDSNVFMKLVNIYCTSFYGSNLWDLYSKDVDRIKFYNTNGDAHYKW